MIKIIAIASISFCFLTLTGCSGYVKPAKGSPTVAQTYFAGNAGQSTYYNADDSSHSSVLSSDDTAALPQSSLQSSLARPSSNRLVNTLDSQFPTIPNPQSLMYIFGHYAGAGRLPVPGHFITFSLYDRTYYALPNEILAPYNDGQFVGQN